jgi:diketogulonate reductase-like aldo/keto reductase
MKCVSEGGELIPPGCPSTAPPRRGRPRHYVDLYLVHWPGGGATWAWPGMEAARARSYARAIGVSNFDTDELDQVIAGASGAPVVDQVQFNPSAYRQVLLDACAERGVALETYSPLGTGELLDDPVLAGIVDRLGRSPAQILLRWCVQRGIPVITKSTHRDRIAENARIFDFQPPRTTWRGSTRSIAQAGPERHWSANGGERCRGRP